MNKAYQTTTIDLIRHGEPEGGPKLRGALDDPLSEQGWQQMRDSVGPGAAWDHIVSSPLQRCRHFATELAQRLACPMSIEQDFREIAFGSWEGLTTEALYKKDPEALKAYWQDPSNHAPEGGEPLHDFMTRIGAAWSNLHHRHAGQHVLLVCHGGVIRAVLTEVLGMPWDNMWNFDVPYANVSRVVYHAFDDGTRLGQLKFHQKQLHL